MQGRKQFAARRWGGALRAALCGAVLLATLAVLRPGPAAAQICPCTCSATHHAATRNVIHQQHQMTRSFITAQFQFHEIWFLDAFFRTYVLPALMMMAENLTAVGGHQINMIGAFFDAQNTLDAQLLIQQKNAEAHKDYQPSVGMCQFGTITRSLAPAQRNSEFNAFVVATRAQDRQLGLMYDSGSTPVRDRESRLAQFKTRYCDIGDNDGGLNLLCGGGGAPETRNNDISFGRMLDQPRTMDVDFSDSIVTDTEQDLLALNSNLYGHELFERIPAATMEYTTADDVYMDVRSIIAKRAVAQNSFAAIVGLKAQAPREISQAQTPQYMQVILRELGVNNADMEYMLGDRPSYYAQMELLTQRVFQNPAFFTNLYDKPANVARKNVALQAVGLMLDRDSFKSELRAEAMTAVWLETELMRYQEEVQSALNAVRDRTKTMDAEAGGAAP